MKVILLKDIKKVGRKFETAEVKDGYALNYLIPQGFARSADPATLASFQAAKEKHEADLKAREEALRGMLEGIGQTPITFVRKANEQGRLFDGVGRDEIVEALKEQHALEVDEHHIKLEHQLKEVGEHEVEVELAGQKGVIKVSIEAEK